MIRGPRQPGSLMTAWRNQAHGLAAALALIALTTTAANAELTLCNRTSYRMEAAFGIEKRASVSTRGWFRIDPAACRVVAQGTLTADRILLNARALGVYGTSPVPQSGGDRAAGDDRAQRQGSRGALLRRARARRADRIAASVHLGFVR